ncbi:MAG: phosphatase PAP2 family protein [Candidatus Nanopelagicaceae bacterium]|nr:phosphatase PAP2 family protein [Candidatus Nanopelagicaceae bacterium]
MGLLSMIIFGELGYFVKSGPTAFDSTVAEWFKSHRTPGEVHFAQIYSAITAPALILIMVCIILLFRQYWNHAWYLIDFVPLALIVSAGGVATLAKLFFDRVRPGIGLAIQFDLEPSFPSGHVAFIAASGGCLLLIYSRRRALTLLLVMIITVFTAFDRLLLGAHWFTDVIGSMFMAAGLFYLMKFVEELLAERERVV